MPSAFVFSGELDGLFIELGPTGADLQDSAGAQIHIDLGLFPGCARCSSSLTRPMSA